MMEPQSVLRTVRPLSGNLLSGLPLTLLMLAGIPAFSQTPKPIPNWSNGQAGTSAGQYAPNQYPQQPQYQQQDPPQPAYQPPPDGQQYQQSQEYQQGYGQALADPDQGGVAPYQPSRALSADQLERMLAPIALYPDNLVSMVLAASTYPAEVSAADQWLHMQGGAPPEQIAAGANAQTTWDPSVKALTAFPQVLDQLSQNLQWTTDVGNAYYNQPQDVMQTVQVLRSRAQSAGNLQSTPQEVVTEEQGNIEIAPPTPQVVYVPAYNPWAVYGAPVDPYPGYSVAGEIGAFVGGLLSYGPGIALDAFAVTPFGWLGWGLDWFAHAIFFGGDVWCSHSYEMHDWGFEHGGGRYWGEHGEMASFRERGGYGQGRDSWQQHAFRSGLDRGSLGGSVMPRALGGGGHGGSYGSTGQQALNHGQQTVGHPQQFAGNPQISRGGTQGHGPAYGGGQQYAGGRTPSVGSGLQYNGGRTPGYSGGQSYPGGRSPSFGGQQYAGGRTPSTGSGLQYNGGRTPGYSGREPYAGGRTPSFSGGQQYAGGRTPNFGSPQQYGENRTPSYGGRQQVYGSGIYNRPVPNYGGGRSAYGNSTAQAYRSPSYNPGPGTRGYSYGASSNNYARGSSGSGGGFHPFGGGRSNSYGGGSYQAPRSSGGFGSHSWGSGGGGFSAPKAPHYSSGGGGHFGGGGGHFGGGGGGGSHFGGGGGGHFGGGGHSGGGGGHSDGGGGHSSGKHH